MIYLLLYLLSVVISGILFTSVGTETAQFAAVGLQGIIYFGMYLYWKKTYDSQGIKQKVIDQSTRPLDERETFVKAGNWGFIILLYFVQQVMSTYMITPVYYLSLTLDFVLIFFAIYPLVIESNIGFKKSGITKVLVMAVMTVVLSLVFNGTYNTIIESLGLVATSGDVSINQQVVVNMVLADPFRSFMMITFSAAIMEEWLFRGLGFRTIIHKNKGLAYLVTFIVFSLPHLASGLLMGSGLSEFIFMPVYGMMGVFFAYSYHHTESIYTSMLAHFLNNGLSFISIVFLSNLL